MADEQQGTQVRHYWPNKLGRMFLLSLEDVMGRQGLNQVLSQARLRHLINNYPAANLDLAWSFEDTAAINQALEELHGPEGGKALAVRAGRAGLYHFLDDLGAVLGLADLAFRLLPLGTQIRLGLNAVADTFNKTSDQIVCIEEQPDAFLFRVERCPICWGRSSSAPVCHALVGLLQESLHWLTHGKDLPVEEVLCIARGDGTCTFKVGKQPL